MLATKPSFLDDATDILYLSLERIFASEGRVEMQCTNCRQHTPDSWAPLFAYDYDPDEDRRFVGGIPLNPPQKEELVVRYDSRREAKYSFQWMRCANEQCKELVVRVKRSLTVWADGGLMGMGREADWLAVPQFAASRPVDQLVQDAQPNMARDYRDASLILDLSHRASAVLSRRVLADLLEAYAGRSEYSLADRIDKFNEETSHPYGLRKNLHYLREIGDLVAHTKRDKDDQASVVDVTREEAEWTLAVVEGLFDYFIVSPAKDKAMRERIDEKIDRASRKPIKELPEDRETE